MGRKHKKEPDFQGRWVLFDRTAYRWVWVSKKVFGVFGLFMRDLKCCWQRITKGYCDNDLYSIYDWFLDVIPSMLEQFKQTRHGSPSVLGEDYVDEDGILVNDTCHEEWDAILDRLIFLFREANEYSCQRKNPYEDEHRRAYAEFTEKYGVLGEKLETPEQKERRLRAGLHTMHFLSEIPEYADIDSKYKAEEKKLDEYREQCQDEALKLFSKWLPHLWD